MRKRGRFSQASAILLTALSVCTLAVAQQPADKADKEERKTIHITAERFSFSPSKIKIKQGATVELVLHSDDTTHGFRIADLDIDELVPSRDELRVLIKSPQKGKYVFECSRPCGAGYNTMRGILIVE